jgi:hypothetical protein
MMFGKSSQTSSESKTEPEAKSAETAAKPAQPPSLIFNAIDRMRETAKWIITSFAAIAVVLVGTSQLSDLGKAEGSRLHIALGGVALGLVSIVAAIYAAGRIFQPKVAELDDITDQSPLGRRAARDPGLLYGQAGTVSELIALYKSRLAEHVKARTEAARHPSDPELAAAAASAEKLYRAVEAPMNYIRQQALYDSNQRTFARSVTSITVLTVFAAIGLVMFAYGANPPEDEAAVAAVTSPAAASFTTPVRVKLALTAEGRDQVNQLVGESCVDSAKTVILLSQDDQRAEFVTLGRNKCPPVRISLNSDLLAETPAP